MKLIFGILIISILGCGKTKESIEKFEKHFLISKKWIKYPGENKLYRVSIYTKDSLTVIKRAYLNCLSDNREKINNETFKIADCTKKLSLKNGKVKIWFEPVEGQDSFKMRDVCVVYSKDGKVQMEETDIKLFLLQ